MLAGLMAATTLGGIAPAYAQNWGERMRGRMEQPSGHAQGQARPGGDAGRSAGRVRADRPATPRAERPAQNWQQRARQNRPAPDVRPSPQPRAESRWNGNDRNRGEVRQGARPGWQGGTARNDRDRRDNDRGAASNVPQRQEWRDRQNDGRSAADDRRWDDNRRNGNDRRWNDNRRNGRDDRNWNRGSANNRFDDRTRWSNQRRWDNGWRNDRRYDWHNYRARYGDRYRAGRYYAPRGWDYGYRRFSIGIFLGAPLYANNYWLDDPWSYRLPPAYGTLRWVRYYDDALLVDVRDGYVVDVIHNFFW